MFGLLFATFGVILSAKYSSITVDQSALLALKSHITHDPHNFWTTNWSTSTSVCSWIGVTCGSKHYRVTALNLSSMDLTGTISSQLGNLSFLAWLDIHQNSFLGSLPIELTNLRRMKYLDFGNNSFNGEIPLWFGCFSKLQTLSLYLNNFIGVIPSTLGNLSKLERLSLGGNQITGRIPNSLFKCKELKFLSLFNNSLEGSIPTEIENLTLLKTLGLGINHFKGKIPSTIGNLTTLEPYPLPNFTVNQINLVALKSHRLLLLINSNITTLDALGHLPLEIFDNLSKLQVLKLRGDKISGRIPNSLIKCNELTFLSFYNNSLGASIPMEI
ncbi:hypothetical protein V6Z11_D11G340400 [Gossypium hirsutum]